MDVSKNAPRDAQAICAIFRDLYSNTFFSRYSFQKQKSVLGLSLQPALAVRQFFEGGWLEWCAFMQLLSMCVERHVEFACARGMKLEFPNEDLRELDVVFLIRKRFPIIIECKSGEFRPDIDKYTKLRSRLGLDRSQVIICNPDLDDDRVKGLNAMYELTFANLAALKAHLAALL